MRKIIDYYSIMIAANQFYIYFLVISFVTLLTIIIYSLTDNLHNKDVKWEVALSVRFSKVIVYEYIYIYVINKVKWNVRKMDF